MSQRKFISQAEAHRLKKRVAMLEQQNKERVARYSNDYPGGHHIATLTVADPYVRGRLAAVTMFNCALVARFNDADVTLYAILPS